MTDDMGKQRAALARMAARIATGWTRAAVYHDSQYYWLAATEPTTRRASSILWTRRGFAYGPFVRRRK